MSTDSIGLSTKVCEANLIIYNILCTRMGKDSVNLADGERHKQLGDDVSLFDA